MIWTDFGQTIIMLAGGFVLMVLGKEYIFPCIETTPFNCFVSVIFIFGFGNITTADVKTITMDAVFFFNLNLSNSIPQSGFFISGQ